MKKQAFVVGVFAVLLSLAGCPWWRDEPKKQAAFKVQRCASPNACGADQTCDPVTQSCVDVCGAACSVDQDAVQTAAGGSCLCVNSDGVGSPCLTDGDCAAVSGFTSVRQLCRAVTVPPASTPAWPGGMTCVPESGCTVGVPGTCPDPDPSPQIDRECLAAGTGAGAVGACTTVCLDASQTVRTVCRFDQIPLVNSTTNVCTCVSRADPYGAPCTSNADCAWPAGVLGNAGASRTCENVNGVKTCVPVGFCQKDELKSTCGNGVNDDCDGVPEEDEPACQVEQCPDRDADGYCDMGACSVRKPIASQNDRPRTECHNRSEFGSCDAPGMGMRNPSVPETCNGIDDNCDSGLTIDEGCQFFCQDVDGDGWPRSQPRVSAKAPPAADWEVCSNLLEHPTCDDAAHRDVHSESVCNAVCTAGQAQSCQRNGCTGTQNCIGGVAWSDCAAPRPCPDGWSWDGASCLWTSPNQPSYVKYYPHRAGNDAVAATAGISYPAAGGQPGPVYVEVTLEQWSTPPAPGGGHYCGKDAFVSTWVGCIHPDGRRNFGVNAGRDVADREWQENVTIPLRCDAGDLVGVYKYSWGHLSSWHCTRQLDLLVIRNHDPIASCRW